MHKQTAAKQLLRRNCQFFSFAHYMNVIEIMVIGSTCHQVALHTHETFNLNGQSSVYSADEFY